MIAKIQSLPRPARIAVFFLFVVAVIVIFGGLTVAIIVGSARSMPRVNAVPIQPDAVTVEEFTTLSDNDAYPAALAVSPEDTLYTGSYATGAVWAVSPDGEVTELPQTRDAIGSVSGLTVATDGTLYVLDRLDPLQSSGAVIWQIVPSIPPVSLVTLDEAGRNGVSLPDDIAIDAAGQIYITDRGPDNVWRFSPDGTQGDVWWRPTLTDHPLGPSITGLAYDATQDAMIITDAVMNAIYSVPVASENPIEDSTVLYHYERQEMQPGFDGVDVAPDGTIYVAALGQNRVGSLNRDTGEITYLAGNFRGSSDVAFAGQSGRLYITNWDQRSLLPITLLFLQFDLDPRLPFAIDVLTFEPSPSPDETQP